MRTVLLPCSNILVACKLPSCCIHSRCLCSVDYNRYDTFNTTFNLHLLCHSTRKEGLEPICDLNMCVSLASVLRFMFGEIFIQVLAFYFPFSS